jgi:GxxExxY protein
MNTMIKQEYPVFQRCLAIEMKHQGLECSREHEMEISYKSEHIGTRRVDFFCRGKSNG